MKKNPARSLTAAVIAIAFAAAAQATPIYFNFTGTNFGNSNPPLDGAALGQPVSGGFIFETDRLTRSEQPGQVAFTDWLPTDPALPLAFLSSPGRDVALPAYGGSNYSFINFNFPCVSGPGCESVQPDTVTMAASSSELPTDGVAADFTGTLRGTFIYFGATFQSPDTSLNSYSIDPAAILGATLSNGFGVYEEDLWNCVSGECDSSYRSFSFSMDSYSASVGVPEPGSLGLMAAALFALIFMRRRRAAFAR
jgi:PEP-CTERM motif